MKSESLTFHRLFYRINTLAILLVFILGQSVIVKAQKLPPLLKTSETTPSSAFNKDAIAALQKGYDDNVVKTDEPSLELARQYRNRLIAIGREQTDAFFLSYQQIDRKHREWLQFTLDFLEIGAAAAISMTNGTRAKTVIAIGLGALQASRTSLNKNFRLLERQILINKMIENRALTLASILSKLDNNVKDYSWELARSELRDYFIAGTLDDALSSLSTSTGQAASNAEEKLRIVSEDITILPESSATDLMSARDANKTLDRLNANFKSATSAADKTAALKPFLDILDELRKDPDLKQQIDAKSLTTLTDGDKIIEGIRQIRKAFTLDKRLQLARKINITINLIGNK